VATTVDLPRAPPRRGRLNLSLRTKGILAVTVLVACVVLTGLFVARQREELVLIVQELEVNHATQGLTGEAMNGLARMLSTIRSPEGREIPAPDPSLRPALAELVKLFPVLEREIRDLDALLAAPRATLDGPAVAELADRQRQMLEKLHLIQRGLRDRNVRLAALYRESQRSITLAIVTTHVAGVLGSIVAVIVFFTGIARDIRRLQDRASAIVQGYDGPPLANRRGDEIGGLIDAINRMQADLRRAERRREITRQQLFHQEKMAAVGSMASAIGHEVSNPIAAISGVAQFMADETREVPDEKGRRLHEFAAEILRQTQRITTILRQLGTLTTPPSPEPSLLELNSLVRSTCSFICYDKRFRGIHLDFDLDPALPAVNTVADHLTQVLMNLMINAADALQGEGAPESPWIRVSTSQVAGGIQVTLQDNGHGMGAEVLARAFDESFTTKPAGRGRGIGLFLCKTLMEETGGRIELASTPGVGTTATLFLPLSLAPNA
jgi:two-component system NtrC family sensor kinase